MTDGDDRDERENEDESPSLAQRVHAATGDRDAEAEALRRQAGDHIDHDDAKIAVQRAHGEAGVDAPGPEGADPDEALAVPADAEAVHDEQS